MFSNKNSKFFSCLEYDLEIQARLPAALCAIHTFTRDHESDIREPDNNGVHIDFGNYGGGQFEAEGLGADNEETVAMRDRIAEKMGENYQNYIQDQEEEEE